MHLHYDIPEPLKFNGNDLKDKQDQKLANLYGIYHDQYRWIACFIYPYLPACYHPNEEYKEQKFGFTAFLSNMAQVSLLCYAVDVLLVMLLMIGFELVEKWQIAITYSKIAYNYWAIKKSLKLKTVLLWKAFQIDKIESGSCIKIVNRLLNALIVTLVTLLLFDWLSAKMGMAMKGLFALGLSVPWPSPWQAKAW
jgi:hypothetical protein